MKRETIDAIEKPSGCRKSTMKRFDTSVMKPRHLFIPGTSHIVAVSFHPLAVTSGCF